MVNACQEIATEEYTPPFNVHLALSAKSIAVWLLVASG
jgi:hypothetical protein